jgi:hypothetical protein
LHKEIVDPDKITVILDQHLDIKIVFERLDFGWQKLADEVVQHFYDQRIAQNMYKDCHIKRVNIIFKQAARHKKSWRCEKYLKKINNIRRTSHKYIKKKKNHSRKSPNECYICVNRTSVQQKI